LVGESGSGKTMALRMLAGLMVPDEGNIELEGETYFHSGRAQFVPSERRAIGYMAQDYALFPHLSALENVAFGLRAPECAEPARGGAPAPCSTASRSPISPSGAPPDVGRAAAARGARARLGSRTQAAPP
jgi:ABC-type sugar transport system ATPase subunit